MSSARPRRTADAPPRVLIVDDDPEIRALFAMVIEEAGYVVETAEHGAAALERMGAGFHPRLLVVDLHMPVMDGASLLARLHDQPTWGEAPPTVILLSAARELEQVARRFGVAALSKPCPLESLLALMRLSLDASPVAGVPDARSGRLC